MKAGELGFEPRQAGQTHKSLRLRAWGNTVLLVFYWALRDDTGRVYAILGAWVALATRKHKSLRVRGVGNTVLLVFYWALRDDTGRGLSILGVGGVSLFSDAFLGLVLCDASGCGLVDERVGAG